MHHFHPQIGTIQDVLPAIHDMALCVQHTLIEVEAIQVKGHRANTQGGEPNANDWPHGQEEMQCTRGIRNACEKPKRPQKVKCSLLPFDW